MKMTIRDRTLLVALESERTAEAFVLAAISEPNKREKYMRAAHILQEQAEAVRLSA